MDHYTSAIDHRQAAEEARDQLVTLHEADRGGVEIRRRIAQHYDRVRHSLKLAEIDALLSIGQALRDLRSTIELTGDRR